MKKTIKIFLPCLGVLAIATLAFKSPNAQKEEADLLKNSSTESYSNLSEGDRLQTVLGAKIDVSEASFSNISDEDKTREIIADNE